MKFLIVSCAVLALAAAEVFVKTPVTLKETRDLTPDGAYSFSYETENGIYQAESGSPVVVDPTKPPVVVSQGQYQYTSPEGIPIVVSYVADQNGFHAEGEHIPAPSPLIQRALEYIRSHPPQLEHGII